MIRRRNNARVCLTRASFPRTDSMKKKKNDASFLFFSFWCRGQPSWRIAENVQEYHCFHSRDAKVNCFWLDVGVYKFSPKFTWDAIYLYNICGNHLVWAFPRFILKCKGEAPKTSTSKNVSNQTIFCTFLYNSFPQDVLLREKRHQIHKKWD